MDGDTLRYLCWCKSGLAIVALAAFWTWESWLPFLAAGPGRWRHAARNVSFGYCGALLVALCFGSATALVTSATTARGWGLMHAFDLPGWLLWPLALLTLDGWMYVWHRLNHAIPWLWRFHRVHHSDLAMDVTSATRFHVGELVQSALLRLALIPLLGWELPHLLVYDALVMAVTYFHHANVSLGRWDRWLRVVIVTPFVHKVHHSDAPSETDSNYGTVLTLWDRLAGSLRIRSSWRGFRFGLGGEHDEAAQSWWRMLRMPFSTPAGREQRPVRPPSLPIAGVLRRPPAPAATAERSVLP